MKLRTPALCTLLFTIGITGGWLTAGRGIQGATSPPVACNARRPTGSHPAGLPAPSGLPGDLIHLSRIPDTRTLRAVWKTGDWQEEKALVERWAELDPADGLHFFLLDLVNGGARDTTHAETISYAWAERDPDAYLRFLADLPGSIPYPLTNALDWVARRRLQSSPEAFLTYWKTAPGPIRQATFRQVFENLFQNDPARALAEAAQVSGSGCGNPWMDAEETKDPALILPAFIAAGAVYRNLYTFRKLLTNLAEKDLPAAQELVITLPAGEVRTMAAQEVVEKMLELDPDAALTWLEKHAPTARNRQLVAEALLKTDPERALSMEVDDSLWKGSDVLKEYSATLAEKDWAAAVALIHTSQPGMQKALTEGIMDSLPWRSGEDPLPRLEKFSEILTGTDGKSVDLSSDTFSGLDPQQAPAVTAWLVQQPPEVQQALLQPLAYRLNQVSPATAANWLAGLPASEARTTELINTTSSWADDAPQAAAAFSRALPPGTDRDYAILNTAVAWHRNDPAAARAWLDALPDSTGKTKALAGINLP